MKSIAVVLIALTLAVLVIRYCVRDRRISSRPGAFYIVVVALACEAVLVSVFVVETAGWLRSSSDGDRSEIGLTLPFAGDPGGVEMIAGQVTEFTKPKGGSPGEWLVWQMRLRRFLTTEVFELSERSPVESAKSTEVTGESGDSELVRRDYLIPGAGGDPIPAVLLMPRDQARPLPGILLIPGHVPDGHSGLGEMILDVESYHGSAARRLAEAGFLTLTIELRGFGMRGPPRYPDHRAVAYNSLLAGDFFKNWVFQDIREALDFLISLPGIDSHRIGMAGASLGGEIAVEYAALDQRVRVVSFHAHGGRIGSFPALSRTPDKFPHLCHLIPGVNEVMERQDPFLLLAPRALQGVRGGDQPFADKHFKGELRSLWAILDAEDRLELLDMPDPQPYNGHVFYVAESIRFFKKHLL